MAHRAGRPCGQRAPGEADEPGRPADRLGQNQGLGLGGYYARIFLNVEGREPQGIVPPDDYEKERDALIERLLAIRGPNGEPWATKVIKPQEYYEELEGEYPDLMVYFDDLYWRSAGTLGYGTKYLPENDTGPDDAVHAQEGIFILSDPRVRTAKTMNADILDIAPTVLDIMGIPVPEGLKGKVIPRPQS